MTLDWADLYSTLPVVQIQLWWSGGGGSDGAQANTMDGGIKVIYCVVLRWARAHPDIVLRGMSSREQYWLMEEKCENICTGQESTKAPGPRFRESESQCQPIKYRVSVV